jgi:hypothetical protein
VEITPLKPSQLQLAQFGYQQFNVELPEQVSKEALIDPALWVHSATKMRLNDEVRIVDAGGTMWAKLIVTFANGHDVRLQLLEYRIFEEEEVPEVQEEHFVKLRGQQKWCIMKRGNPDPIIQGIATKHDAEREKTEYLRALKS